MHDALGNYLREMDPAHRAFMTIFFAVMIKSVMIAKYSAWKARKEREPVPMKLRRGVYVPNGPVQKMERFLNAVMYVWLVYMAILIGLLIYMKAMGWDRLF